MRDAWPTFTGTPIYRLTTEPAGLADDMLADIKSSLRIIGDDQDVVITALIAGVIEYFDGRDGHLHRALQTQSWSVSLSGPDCRGRIYAPLSPVQALEEITYFDADGAEQTATLTDFRVTNGGTYAYCEPKPGKAWPAAECRQDAITATWRVGYGATPADIPPNIRHAITLMVGHYFEHREATTLLKVSELPLGVEALIAKHKIMRAA